MKPIKITKKVKYWHARFDTPDKYNEFRTPAWAKKVSESIIKGSKVTTASTSDSSEWVVQKIMIPTSVKTEEEVKKLSEGIYDKLNISTPKDSVKKVKDNPSSTIIDWESHAGYMSDKSIIKHALENRKHFIVSEGIIEKYPELNSYQYEHKRIPALIEIIDSGKHVMINDKGICQYQNSSDNPGECPKDNPGKTYKKDKNKGKNPISLEEVSSIYYDLDSEYKYTKGETEQEIIDDLHKVYKVDKSIIKKIIDKNREGKSGVTIYEEIEADNPGECPKDNPGKTNKKSKSKGKNPISLEKVYSIYHDLDSESKYRPGTRQAAIDDLHKVYKVDKSLIEKIVDKYKEGKSGVTIYEEIEKEYYSSTFNYLKGDNMIIDMGDGEEEVIVMKDFKAGLSGINFITLKRVEGGSPYTITESKLKKVLINKSKEKGNPISFDGVREIISESYDNYEELVKKYDSDLVDGIIKKHKEGKSPRQIHEEIENEYHSKENIIITKKLKLNKNG